MNEHLWPFLSSAGGVALIGGVFALAKWILERIAARRDKKMGKKTFDERLEALEKAIQENVKLNEVEIAGLRSLLYSEIKERARHALAAGYITAEDLEDLIRKHELYHGPLEGNGFLSSLMEQVCALPVHD